MPPFLPRSRGEFGKHFHLELESVDGWMAGWPQARRAGNGGSDGRGLGTTLIVGDATAPLEDVADPVGPDMMRCIRS